MTAPASELAPPLTRRQLMIGVLALTAAGCVRRRPTDRDSTLIIGGTYFGRIFSPSVDNDAKHLVFLSLAAWGPNGKLEGRLAERWEPSPDYHEWTYHLRRNVRWHDGVPVTAHDVKFTFDLEIRPDVLQESRSLFQSVDVLDDWTVRIRSVNTTGYLLDNIVFPRHLLESLDPAKFREWDFWSHPVGDGPYRFKRTVPDVMVELGANSDFYGGKPAIERVVLKTVSTGAHAISELRSGAVDLLVYADPAQIPILRSEPRFRAYFEIFEWGSLAIFWQTRGALLSDPRVRRALTMAIDRRELLGILNWPRDLPIYDGPLMGHQVERHQWPDPLPYDPTQARALLEQAGWHEVGGDGVREHEGQRLQLIGLVPPEVPYRTIATYVQDRLRRVGVRLELLFLERASMRARLSTGTFDAYFGGKTTSPEGVAGVFEFYPNPAVARLIAEAKLTDAPAEQDRIYGELMDICRTEMPVTFLFPGVTTFFAHRRVHGLSSPWRGNPMPRMDELSLGPAEGR